MKSFEYSRVGDYEEAAGRIQNSSKTAEVISGGTDFLNMWKDQNLLEYPEQVLQIDRIKDADRFEKTQNGWSIGAETRLDTLAKQDEIPVLAAAAGSIANEQIRNAATVAGDIFQDVHCKYYRYTDFMGGRVVCRRKGGELCCAMHGESEHHSVFGGMRTHETPCSQACPAGTDIPAYAEEIRKGNIKKAAQILMGANPFPMLLSRVCPHPCETKCNQAKFGDGVSIHNLERMLGDYILEHRDEFYCAPDQENGKKIAVVGGGPGGLSAAFYLRRAGCGVTVIERKPQAGGVMRYGIPHYRLPKHYLDQVTDSLEKMGVGFRFNTVVGEDVQVEELLEEYDFVYLGTGAWKQPVLGIGREEVAEFGLNFLTGVNQFLRKNIDSRVLICGGGNVAMDAALTAVRLGAEQVTLICLEKEKEMPASPDEIARCREEGVEICCGWGLQEIVADADGKPEGMLAKKCLSVYDENHRFSPRYSESETKLFPAQTIILATGQRVDISYLGEDLMKKLASARGLIDTDLVTGATSCDRIYAGGDAAFGPNIASRAVAGGRRAADGICAKLGLKKEDKKDCAERAGAFATLDTQGISSAKACKTPRKDVPERTLYEEDAFTADWDTILQEAKRCMNCSCFAVNSSDLAPVLLLLDAQFVTTQRVISAEELLTSRKSALEVLEKGELLKEIRIPEKSYERLSFEKTADTKGRQCAHVSLAAGISGSRDQIKAARFVFGGVAGIPYEAAKAAEYLKNQKLSTETIEKAASLAVEDACNFEDNKERVWEMKRLLRGALEAVRA
ncbi:MAG: FAD-dependent oxidoreductase [Lachnospiraceae bacterium]|nr:FAD-dependent oxidoreductase [Lachnospiraceae bacterium]